MAKTSNERIKSLCSMAMLTAIAIVADILIRIPNIGGFLTYEPKDVVLTIGGFIFGPVAGILMALVVCLIEMVTISTTGIIGFVMNFLASGVFIGVASIIYFKKKNLSRAIIGLVASTLSLIVVMLLWNYIMTPIFFGMPRETVLDMFLPLLIPFNAIKGALNSALTLLLYKGVVTALRKSGLVPKRESADNENFKTNTIILIIVSAFIVATLILVLLIFAGII